MSDKMREALHRIAALNDLSGAPDDAIEAYARAALHECELVAREALAAIPTTDAGDWVMVPRVPTEAMVGAGLSANEYPDALRVWSAKIAASPTPSTEVGEDEVAEAYVIRRHGAFFRPDAAGYTAYAIAAGRYTKAEAEGYLQAEGVTIHPLTDYRAEIENMFDLSRAAIAAIRKGER